jgi:hypothetical protein
MAAQIKGARLCVPYILFTNSFAPVNCKDCGVAPAGDHYRTVSTRIRWTKKPLRRYFRFYPFLVFQDFMPQDIQIGNSIIESL